MSNVVLSARVPADLAEWVEQRAAKKLLSKGQLVQHALEIFRVDTESGVPTTRAALRSSFPVDAGVKRTRAPHDPSLPMEQQKGDFARLTLERSELFRTLRCPDSIKGTRKGATA